MSGRPLNDAVLRRLEALLDAGSVELGPASLERFAVDGVRPSAVVKPQNAEQAAAVIRFAKSEKLAVIPCGRGTKLGIGMPPARYDLALDMTGLREVAYYDPDDLTLSVDAGMDLPALAEALAEQRQFVPLAVPFFDESTVGGAVASGIGSTLREGYGTARDFLLGAEFVSGSGALTKSGGRVVKNVSGYDLHKVLIGSLGTLGAITRLNFRTFPSPQGHGQMVAAFSSIKGLLRFTGLVQKSPLSPSSLNILSPHAAKAAAEFREDRNVPRLKWFAEGCWHACVLFEGTEAVIRRYTTDLHRYAKQAVATSVDFRELPQGESLSGALREFVNLQVWPGPAATIFCIRALPVFSSAVLQLQDISQKFSLSCSIFGSVSGPLYLAVSAERSDESTIFALAQLATEVFAYAESQRGDASILFCPAELKRVVNVWGPARNDAGIMRRVKKAFDPENIFAPGRFAAGI